MNQIPAGTYILNLPDDQVLEYFDSADRQWHRSPSKGRIKLRSDGTCFRISEEVKLEPVAFP